MCWKKKSVVLWVCRPFFHGVCVCVHWEMWAEVAEHKIVSPSKVAHVMHVRMMMSKSNNVGFVAIIIFFLSSSLASLPPRRAYIRLAALFYSLPAIELFEVFLLLLRSHIFIWFACLRSYHIVLGWSAFSYHLYFSATFLRHVKERVKSRGQMNEHDVLLLFVCLLVLQEECVYTEKR